MTINAETLKTEDIFYLSPSGNVWVHFGEHSCTHSCEHSSALPAILHHVFSAVHRVGNQHSRTINFEHIRPQLANFAWLTVSFTSHQKQRYKKLAQMSFSILTCVWTPFCKVFIFLHAFFILLSLWVTLQDAFHKKRHAQYQSPCYN